MGRALLLGLLAAGQGAAGAERDRHVVVISVDGLPGRYLDDPRATLPTIRALRARGVAAAGGMVAVTPTVTWPNHTSMMTGLYPERHGVLFNGRPVRGEAGRPTVVIPASSQAELVRVPLLFDILKEQGLTSSAIFWPCTRESPSLVANFPDVPDPLRYTTESLRAKLAELPRYEDGGGAVRDEIWTEAACRTIVDDRPNLLALHLLVLDGTHHSFGPETAAGYTAAALCDANVGRVLAAIDRAGIADRTDVFVVSDHGFANTPKALRPNAILRREGLLRLDGERVVECRAHVVPEGGLGMVYLTDPSTREADRATVRRLFEGAEGVAAVLDPADFARYHLPTPADHPGMADMILAARDGYAVSGSGAGGDLVAANDGSIGTHGFLATEPKMIATFVAAGPGIRPGATLDRAAMVDLAPTVARLLGVSLENTDGRVLSEILAPEATAPAATGR